MVGGRGSRRARLGTDQGKAREEDHVESQVVHGP